METIIGYDLNVDTLDMTEPTLFNSDIDNYDQFTAEEEALWYSC